MNVPSAAMLRRSSMAAFALLSLAGCRATVPPPGTGAEAAVRDYYEAIVRHDWAAAHALVHTDSRAKYPADRFAQQAQSFRRQIGFEPEKVVVRSCEEHGAEAIAHVVVKGADRSFRDAVVLRQSPAGWGVVLPPRFGEKG